MNTHHSDSKYVNKINRELIMIERNATILITPPFQHRVEKFL